MRALVLAVCILIFAVLVLSCEDYGSPTEFAHKDTDRVSLAKGGEKPIGPRGWEVVQERVSVLANTVVDKTMYCPAGKHVLNAGWSSPPDPDFPTWDQAAGEVFEWSKPGDGTSLRPDSWTFRIRCRWYSGTETCEPVVYVVCAN